MDTHIEVYGADGQPLPARYSSDEQALRAEVERQKLIIAELVRVLADVTAEMWGNVDADEVILHTDSGAVHVSRKTAAAYWQAANLLTKYGDNNA